MFPTFHEIPTITRPVPIRAQRPTILPPSCREIFEGIWTLEYDWRNKRETEQKRENSASFIFNETVLNSLTIDNPPVVWTDLEQPRDTGLGLMFWGHSNFEWKELPDQPDTQKERRCGDKSSSLWSSLSSLSSLASLNTTPSLPQLDVVEVDAIACNDMEDFGSRFHAVLEWDPVVKQIPPTPMMAPSLLPDVVPVYGELEKAQCSARVQSEDRAYERVDA
ncbi:hypothetical protein B0H21DRAFT_246966 [Amylocystis lapponica]|nr:hypothetical protein B0H21DRAFT_246966 [Amylocystis lapponica]